MSIIYFLLIGLIAGWISGVIMQGKGFGIIGNIAVGIVGALIGGFIGSGQKTPPRRAGRQEWDKFYC